ncbi:hypothetical protein CH294_11635 [Rhodococcus sp. 14-2483-1-1]|uniref:LysR family transcriptional regulator n=1 Tax=Rhodococcus sp. 14-2483-1-1 TaxID=2023148 RepID=UPI000B9B12B4|nr:LysR family transcriptional regulator [Rhodococcus sp. 14-2483-1-1]OZF35291.1 hypothetical protein CH294_11635 [Rhodococcus sp. 14-2483-1-1]
MERRQLEYFLAIVEYGGVTRAATRLHVAQPTISAALRSLEKELGGQLFERGPGRFLLTQAGASLIGPARRVLRDFDLAADSVQDVLGLSGGRISIATVPAIGFGWLTKVLAEFRRLYPAVQVSVDSDIDSQAIADGVADGSHDVGLTVESTVNAGIDGVEVGTQELKALLPPGTPQQEAPIALRDLVSMDLITMHSSTSRRWLETQLGLVGLRPSIAVELSSSDSIVPLVTTGAGYALWWTPMDNGACVLHTIEPSLTRPIRLLRREGKPAPTIEAFLRAVDVVVGTGRAVPEEN